MPSADCRLEAAAVRGVGYVRLARLRGQVALKRKTVAQNFVHYNRSATSGEADGDTHDVEGLRNANRGNDNCDRRHRGRSGVPGEPEESARSSLVQKAYYDYAEMAVDMPELAFPPKQKFDYARTIRRRRSTN